ncbi:MAG: DUF4870 domain-containing protein [Candidatus Magasanikbacteria bacterium]
MTEQQSPQNGDPKDAEKNRGMAVVAYILFFIPLLTDAKDSPFVKFHVKQSLVLLIFGIGGWVISSFLMIILIGFVLYFFVSIAVLVLFIMGIINALNGEMKELPYIGHFAGEWFKF